eukprot:1571265-Pleurochrysis_carterae.AAC.1
MEAAAKDMSAISTGLHSSIRPLEMRCFDTGPSSVVGARSLAKPQSRLAQFCVLKPAARQRVRAHGG